MYSVDCPRIISNDVFALLVKKCICYRLPQPPLSCVRHCKENNFNQFPDESLVKAKKCVLIRRREQV